MGKAICPSSASRAESKIAKPSPSPLGPRRLRLRADPIRLEAREIESRTFRPLSRLLAFLPELPLLHQHVTVAAPWRPEGVPPTGVCRKAPATTSPGRVPALRAAHGPSPGGTEPARLGARRVCSWKAWPRCPSPYTPPQSAPRRKADRGPAAGAPLRAPLCLKTGASHCLLPPRLSVSPRHPPSVWSPATLGSNPKQDCPRARSRDS